MTHDFLLAFLLYDPETGHFTWCAPRKACVVGARAGSQRSDGYRYIRLGYKRHYEHRLAWFYMTGKWPEHEIDHIDANPANNAWANLRLATRDQNARNRSAQSNNLLGIKGVSMTSSGKFSAHICVGKGKVVYLGSFDTPSLASRAYAEAAERFHGEFARAA